MKRLLALGLVMTFLAAAGIRADEPRVIKLWPGKVPGETGKIGPERTLEPKAGEKNPVLRITDISEPTLAIYKPAKDKDTGTAVIVAPGGGYYILAYEHEGTQVAEWLAKSGVTAVLLKYRVPRRPDQAQDQPPMSALQDAQRAVSLVRSKAKDLGIKADRIGMLGFSAGGHLTAWTATNFDKRAYEPVDTADETNSRPDFTILIYPGGLVKKGSPETLSPEIRVSKQTPPTFLVHAADDSAENSLAYVAALRKQGVSAELHLYASGGHGFGMRRIPHPAANWTLRCEEWMRKQGYLQVEGINSPAADKPNAHRKIQELLEKRYAALSESSDILSKRFDQGSITITEMLDAKLRVLRAKLELCDTSDDCINVHQETVKTVESMVRIGKRHEFASRLELLQLEAHLMEAQIALEKAKSSK